MLFKYHILEYHHRSYQKSLHIWEAVKLTKADINFPRFEFLFEGLYFIIGNKHTQLFPFKPGPLLLSFEKISTNIQI